MQSPGHDAAQPRPPPSRLGATLLDHIAADWPEFAAVRAAASAPARKSRLSATLSILVNELRVSAAAAYLCHGAHRPCVGPIAAADQQRADDTVARASRLISHARTLVTDGAPLLEQHWHLTSVQAASVVHQLARTVGPPAECGARDALPIPVAPPRPQRAAFGQSADLFLALIGRGLGIDAAP